MDTPEQTWQLIWISSASDRYDTDMNDRAMRTAQKQGVHVLSAFGGTSLDGAADNGLTIVSSEETAGLVASAISSEVGHEVSVTVVDPVVDEPAEDDEDNEDDNEDEDEDADHSDGDGCAIYDTGYQVHSDGDLDGTVDVEDLEVGDTYNDPAFDAPDEWHSVDDIALVDNGGNDEVHVWTEPTAELPTVGSPEQPSNEEILAFERRVAEEGR